jgi:hypothetical protein
MVPLPSFALYSSTPPSSPMSSCALARPRPSLIVWAKKEEGTHPRARAETERRGHQYCRVFSLLLLSCSVLVPRALLSRLPRTPPPSPNHAFNLLRETRDLVAGPDASVSPARHPWCGRHPIPRGSRAPPPLLIPPTQTLQTLPHTFLRCDTPPPRAIPNIPTSPTRSACTTR